MGFSSVLTAIVRFFQISLGTCMHNFLLFVKHCRKKKVFCRSCHLFIFHNIHFGWQNYIKMPGFMSNLPYLVLKHWRGCHKYCTLKKISSKWIDSSSEGHLQDFSSILKGSSSKIVNWIRGQRSNKSLIFVRNIEVGFLFVFVIFMMNIKLLFDLWPLIQFTIFEKRNLVKLKRNLVSVLWKRNLFILKRFFFLECD